MTVLEARGVHRSLVLVLGGAWTLAVSGLLLGWSVLLLAAAFLGSLALVGTHASRRTRLGGRIRELTPELHEDQEAPFPFQLRNEGARGRLVDWRLELPPAAAVASGESRGVAWLAARSEASLSVTVAFGLFGKQHVGPLHARLGDVFGFASSTFRFAEPLPLRVFPRDADLRESPIRARQKRSLLGAYEVPQPGDGYEFFALREYAPGDRLRDVNWRASARLMDAFVVNQRQRENDTEVIVLVDVRAPTWAGAARDSPFATGVRAALALAHAHLRSRDAVRFIGYGQELYEDRHTGATRHLRGILNLIVTMEPAGGLKLGDVVHRLLPSFRAKSPVVVVSPLVDDPTVFEAITLLMSHGFHVLALVPRPRWPEGGLEDPANAAYERQQQVLIELFRRTGVRMAVLEPGASLAYSLQQVVLA